MKAKSLTADEVRTIRYSLRLRQSDLAATLGVHVVTVARWECGARLCRGRMAAELLGLAAQPPAGQPPAGQPPAGQPPAGPEKLVKANNANNNSDKVGELLDWS